MLSPCAYHLAVLLHELVVAPPDAIPIDVYIHQRVRPGVWGAVRLL